MFSKKIIFTSLCLASSLAMVGCGAQSEKDLLAEAQFCLDTSTEGTAMSCISKISSLQSAEAHALKCSAGFIEAGVVSPQNLSQAITAISNDSSGGSMLMLASLSFGNGQTTLADSTNASCAKSGSSGFALLGSMAKAATTLSNIGGSIVLGSCANPSSCTIQEISNGISENIDNIVDAINNGDPNAEATQEAVEAAVGIASSIVDVYQATCGTVIINQDICGELNSAAQNASGGPIDINAILSATGQQKEDLLKDLALSLMDTWKPTVAPPEG